MMTRNRSIRIDAVSWARQHLPPAHPIDYVSTAAVGFYHGPSSSVSVAAGTRIRGQFRGCTANQVLNMVEYPHQMAEEMSANPRAVHFPLFGKTTLFRGK